MKVYVEVPYVDGTDADYYSFNSLQDAIQWIEEGSITDFKILSEPTLPEDDYTHVTFPK